MSNLLEITIESTVQYQLSDFDSATGILSVNEPRASDDYHVCVRDDHYRCDISLCPPFPTNAKELFRLAYAHNSEITDMIEFHFKEEKGIKVDRKFFEFPEWQHWL